MPKIPRYQATEKLPALRLQRAGPGAFGLFEARALGDVAEGIGDVGDALLEQHLKAKKRKESKYIFDATFALSEKLRGPLAEEYAKAGDQTEGNVKRVQELIKGIQDEWTQNSPSEEATKALKSKFYGMTEGYLMGLARHASKEGRAAYGQKIAQLEDARKKDAYLTPERVGQILINQKGDFAMAIQDGILDRDTANEAFGKFANDVYGAAIDGLIDRGMIAEAENLFQSEEARSALNADSLDYYNDKLEQEKKTIEKEARVREAEAEKKLEDLEKQAKEDEERAIGNQYMIGNYTDAFGLVLRSNRLGGDEKRTWTNAIEKRLKDKPPDPTHQAMAIIEANAMISRELDPDEIRFRILTNPNLTKDDQEQYLNKLETTLKSETATGRRSGYQKIRDLIIPKRGMFANLLETPLETDAVMKAQMALDEWIKAQTKEGYAPTKSEVEIKAMELGHSYQVPLSERMRAMQEEAETQVEEMKAVGEKLRRNKDRKEWSLLSHEARIGDIHETINDLEPRKSDPFPEPVVKAIKRLANEGLTEDQIDKEIRRLIKIGELPTWTMGISEPTPSPKTKELESHINDVIKEREIAKPKTRKPTKAKVYKFKVPERPNEVYTFKVPARPETHIYRGKVPDRPPPPEMGPLHRDEILSLPKDILEQYLRQYPAARAYGG